MKKFSYIIFFILFFSCSSFADVYDHPAKPEFIYSQIPQMGSIKCKFRQVKYIHNISKPVESGGDFEFVENKGVYFHTNYPVKSEVNYTNKNYKEVNDIIKALSSKKYSALERDFNFYFESKNSNWILGMKPKKNSDAINFISCITIEGNSYIHKINIIQKNGNKTLLWFIK